MRKICIVLLLSMAILLGMMSTAFAVDVQSEREYKPLDMVVVLDNSGSMKTSDQNRLALAAVRMLVNMMPAADSRVGVIGFNTKPVPLTKDSAGNATLVPLADFADLKSVRDSVKPDKAVYAHDTAIGNALNAAAELLAQQSDDTHDHAIILFTDGVDDFKDDYAKTPMLWPALYAETEENETKAVQWARKDGCKVYCLGYDYLIPGSGAHSMGANGEGLVKLQNIAGSTGGKFGVINEVKDMEQMMIDFLANVCNLFYKSVSTLPGDGGEYSCEFFVTPGIVEANVRIAGGDANAISAGEIHLYDPSGKEVKLENSGNVRYDVDIGAASIKVIMPQSGKWKLTIKGIRGDEIHVGLLEHSRLSLSSEVSFPDGNPENVAYSGDELGIRAWLTDGGQDVTDESVYDAVTAAKVILVPRSNPDARTETALTLGDKEFTGTVKIPDEAVYDMTIRLEWDTIYRENYITVQSSNRPLALVGDIGDVKVNKNKTVTVDDIFQYVRDEENDPITAEIASVTNADRADVTVNGSQIQITGKKMGSTMVTVRFSDDQGNSVETDFQLKVIDPMVYVIIGLSILVVAAIVVGLILFSVSRTKKIPGSMRVVFIADGTRGDGGKYVTRRIIYENPNMDYDASMDTTVTSFDDLISPIAAPPETRSDDTGGGLYGDGDGGGLYGDGDSGGLYGDGDGGGLYGDGDGGGLYGDGGAQSQSTQPPAGNDSPNAGTPLDLYGMPYDTAQAAEEAQAEEEKRIERAEKARSDLFDERLLAGGTRHHDKTMDMVLRQFLELYKDFMIKGRKESPMYTRVIDFTETALLPALSRIVMKGTPAGGLGGFVMKVDKSALGRQVFVEAPKLKKGKAKLPRNAATRIVITVPVGADDDQQRCHHIELEYRGNVI